MKNHKDFAHRKLADEVYYVGVPDWDRRLFDELVALPDGTSYNSYLIFGDEKTILVDTADPSKEKEYFANLNEFNLNKVDLIISNHAEQDHSGLIPEVLKKFPEAKVVTNSKGKDLLMTLLHIPEDKFLTVNDGDEINIGGKTLKFIFTPWVHWPETMSTFLVEDRILFSGDFFGSHRAASHIFVEDNCKVLNDAKRYYAEIMMPFRNVLKNNIEKVKALNPAMIAPSHGPVYPEPDLIINAYEEWVSAPPKNKASIIFASMHGSVREMVDYLTKSLEELEVDVVQLNVIEKDAGYIAMELVDTATVVFAAPYVLAGIHPWVASVAYFVNALRPKVKFMSFMISYGWGGMGLEHLKTLTKNIQAELIEPIMVKGLPRKEDFDKIRKLAETIKQKHENIGLK